MTLVQSLDHPNEMTRILSYRIVLWFEDRNGVYFSHSCLSTDTMFWIEVFCLNSRLMMCQLLVARLNSSFSPFLCTPFETYFYVTRVHFEMKKITSFSLSLSRFAYVFANILFLLRLWMILLLACASVGTWAAAAGAFADGTFPAALAFMLFVTKKKEKNNNNSTLILRGFSYISAVRYFSVCATILHCVLYPSEKMEHASQPPLYRSLGLGQHLLYRKINYRPLYKHKHKINIFIVAIRVCVCV